MQVISSAMQDLSIFKKIMTLRRATALYALPGIMGVIFLVRFTEARLAVIKPKLLRSRPQISFAELGQKAIDVLVGDFRGGEKTATVPIDHH